MLQQNKLELLEQVLSRINSSVSPQELLNYLIDRCIELTGALTGSIMLINPDTEVLEIRVFRGLQPDQVALTNLKVGEGVTGHVAQTGKPMLINNVDEVDYYVRIREDLCSELAVPLKLEQKTIGVVSVDSNKKDVFTQEHLELLQTISNFAAQILEKANLIENLREKIENQSLLLNIAEILEQGFPLSHMFQQIMNIVTKTMSINRGMLVLLDQDDKLKVFAGHRLSEDAIKRGVYQVGEGIIGRVYKYGKSLAIKNIAQSKEFLNKMKIRRPRGDKYSFFAVPIRYEKKVVGVFSIEKKYTSEDRFSSTLEVVSLIASLVSNKVHNYVINQREKEEILKKNIELKERLLEKESGGIFIGKNDKIREILETVNLVADTDASVLITGQTGTGKEVLARQIHFKSPRWDKPFISVNCAAIPENLLESELFGYKKGSFTGAIKDKRGKFLLAHKGTIFLDEIGDLDFNLQAKILRALQEKTIEPLGAEKQIRVDVRIIAATNKNLFELVQQGDFRQDLYYRLNVIHIDLPSLQYRKDDIPLFIEHFITIYNKKYQKNIAQVAPNCQEMLINYTWPGNIRELQNIIERAVILSKSNQIEVKNLPQHMTNQLKINHDDKETLIKIVNQEIEQAAEGYVYNTVIGKVEKHLIERALINSNNKQVEAADFLGIHRNTIRNKIKQYKIMS